MEDYDDVYKFVKEGVYPSGYSKNEKRNFRRKCIENFMIKDSQLYYHPHSRSGKSSAATIQDWRLCIKTEEEKEKVFISCHSSATGIQNRIYSLSHASRCITIVLVPSVSMIIMQLVCSYKYLTSYIMCTL